MTCHEPSIHGTPPQSPPSAAGGSLSGRDVLCKQVNQSSSGHDASARALTGTFACAERERSPPRGTASGPLHDRQTRGKPAGREHEAMQVETRSATSQDGELQEIARRANGIAANIASVILGKEEVIRAAVVASAGRRPHHHRGLSRESGRRCSPRRWRDPSSCRFARIQFTPDLLPSDVTGVSVFNQKTSGFEFRQGPIFANIVLADEINRVVAEDPVEPAGVHGGAAGDDRQRDALRSPRPSW